MDSPFSPPAGDVLTEQSPPAARSADPAADRHPDAIVSGVAATIADRLGLDPLWIRLAFVVLTLLSGLGLLVYLGLWLVLVVGDGESRGWARIAGGAVLVGVVPLVIATADVEFASGPLAVVALLGGLALALWRSEPVADRRPPVAATRLPEPGASGPAEPAAATVTAPTTPHRSPRARREPSTLGQLTLGLAVIVAAGGALIDELNGGRLHPEQWLGAAAIVCGLGLLVGAVRGHARWLVVPALVLATFGYGGGLLARSGVGVTETFGDKYLYVGAESPQRLSSEVGFGRSLVSVVEAPREPSVVDARMAIGELTVEVYDGIAVEVRTTGDDVTVRRDGETIRADRVTIGPDRRPDVVVNATLQRGTIEIRRVFSEGFVVPAEGGQLISDGPPVLDRVTVVADGVGVTPEGLLVLGPREAIVTSDLEMVLGDGVWLDDGSFLVTTSYGDYRLVDDVLITPDLAVYRLADIRELATESTSAPAEPGVADE